ncbi:hypothetical protein FPK71_25705, partial [Acinetobacter baumannii]|nr:hypothetical protein [Acinetobacter baumannii]
SEFGGIQFGDLVNAQIRGLSKDIALVEKFGSNPKTAFKILKDAANKKDRDAKRVTTEDNKALNRAQVMFDEFNGGNSPQSQV